MRKWRDLFEDGSRKTSPILDQFIHNLKINVQDGYNQAVSLQRELNYHLEMQSILENTNTLLETQKVLVDAVPIVEKVEPLDTSERDTKLNFYLEIILSLSVERNQDKENFYHYLPLIHDASNLNLLDRLLYFLAKEKRDYISLLDDFTGEDRQFALQHISQLEQKMNLIHTYMNPTVIEKTQLHPHKNSLVFLKTSSGNACILSNLKSKSVPIEEYPSFLRLLKSIQEGTFQNLRKLESRSSLYEVKDGSSRVVFSRVYKDYYCILTAFVKKCWWEKELEELLSNVDYQYANQAVSIYKELESENLEFINSERKIEERIFGLLENKRVGGETEKCLKKL